VAHRCVSTLTHTVIFAAALMFSRRALINQNNVTIAFCGCAQLTVLTPNSHVHLERSPPVGAQCLWRFMFLRRGRRLHKQINFSLFGNKYLCATPKHFFDISETSIQKASETETQTSKVGVEGKTLRRLLMQFCVQRVAPVSLCQCVVFYRSSSLTPRDIEICAVNHGLPRMVLIS